MRKIFVIALLLSALVTLVGCSTGTVEVAKIDETYACVREVKLDSGYFASRFAMDTMPREIKDSWGSSRAEDEWQRLIFLRTGRASTLTLDEGDVMMVPTRCPSDTQPGELVESAMRP
jgi:hypothetical protein